MIGSSCTTSTLRALILLSIFVLVSSSASALPPASGSTCRSDWVNNEAAMQCFIKGEEETRNGVKHPRYVACTSAGEVFCCVDDDRGNQDCEVAQAAGSTSEADKIRAIIEAHRAMLTTMKRWQSKDEPSQSEVLGSTGGGARILVRNGLAEIQVKCAESDTTRQCVDVIRPIISQPGGGGSTIYATTSIKCGSTIYEVSTGNNAGNCSVAGPENGPRESAGCNDAPSGGNSASANCQTGCGATTGSGSCTIKSAQ
jgi:hypothetical protein